MKSEHDAPDVLEQNVTTLLGDSGDAPRMNDLSRQRIKTHLVAQFGTDAKKRSPMVPVAAGLAAVAAAAIAVVVIGKTGPAEDPGTAVVPDADDSDKPMQLADGSTVIAEPSAKVTVVGDRHVRVEGAALLDVAPGKGTFVVDTARGKIEVLGTRFVVDGEPDKTTTAVVRGEVRLASDKGDVTLHAGEQGIAEANKAPTRGPAPRLTHLVSWAQEARRKAETDLEPAHHGTLFAREPNRPWVQESPLPIAKLGVDVVVEDRVARVALDQTFHNPAPQEMEGMYRFAIPSDAALQRLAMYVDGHLEESAVVERMAARRIYEEQVYRRVDPALLEWTGTGRLALRVYPLPANQDKRLMVAYTQSLPRLYDDWTLTVPLPEVDQPVGEVEVTMKVKGCANCELTSTSHKIEVGHSGDDATVTYHANGAKLRDSFVLHVRDSRKTPVVAAKTDGGEKYLMVRAPAELNGAAPAYRPRTWVLLDDVSASRDKLARRAQADLVDAFIREVDENDKIAVVAFDVSARVKLAATRAMDVDRVKLRTALMKEGGVGATDLGAALDASLPLLDGAPADDAMIVYLGDGVVTTGPQHLDELRTKLMGKAHFIGVGVGDGPDTQTLDSLAGSTGGFSTTIDLADDLGWRAFDLVAALHTSRATGVTTKLVDANGKDVAATAYTRSAQLADGEELELVAKLNDGAAAPVAVEVSGTRDGAAWHQRIALDKVANADAGFLPRLWAQRHIAARLLAKHEPVQMPICTATDNKCADDEKTVRDQRDEVIRKEIVALGKKYFLLSRHTSLLVLENDAMYAKYGIQKGAGDTWAPYAMPATIPVKTYTMYQAPPSVPVPDSATLVRSPLQLFNEYGYGYGYGTYGTVDLAGGVEGGMIESKSARISASTGMGMGSASAADSTAEPQPTHMEKSANKDLDRSANDEDPNTEGQTTLHADDKAKADPMQPVEVSSDELNGNLQEGRFGKMNARGAAMREHARTAGYWNPYGYKYGASAGPLVASRYMFANDALYDDLSVLVPALYADLSDDWRKDFGPVAAKPLPIDAKAQALLARAHERLASGVYHWGTAEVAVDDAHAFGWRRVGQDAVEELASAGPSGWTRRYPELGIDATRTADDEQLFAALGNFPLWTAEPAAYAKHFAVRAKGDHAVELVRPAKPADQVMFVMTFDDADRLVSITDPAGRPIVEVSWSSMGPIQASMLGKKIAVGYTASSVPSAAEWAMRGTQAGVAVSLPMRVPGFWKKALASETVGSDAWRNEQRQLMASLATAENRGELGAAYKELAAHGGVSLGDLVLASAGTASLSDADFTAALAPFQNDVAHLPQCGVLGPPCMNGNTLVGDARPTAVRYLAASRAWAKAGKSAALAGSHHDGAIGALWDLRVITAKLAESDFKGAVDDLVAMGDRAPLRRLTAASAMTTNYYSQDATVTVRAWDALAVGQLKNVARAQAAFALMQRGKVDEAADRMVTLANELDLDADAPSLTYAPYIFQASRRGTAGWQLAWAQMREKVMAGGSFEHVFALVQASQDHQADQLALLGRAAELAGDDIEKKVTVARTAWMFGQAAYAQQLLEAVVKRAPSHELYQMLGQIAWQQGRGPEALAAFEAAMDAPGEDKVDINVMRNEYMQILQVARTVALQSTGAARADVASRALVWGSKWREEDPNNTQIDAQLGELELALGDKAEAWRQLSTAIERDPMSGDGYQQVAQVFENQGKVAEALDYWEQAIRIDQTNPTPRIRKARALIALGKTKEGDALLHEIAGRKWHEKWDGVMYEVQDLLNRGR